MAPYFPTWAINHSTAAVAAIAWTLLAVVAWRSRRRLVSLGLLVAATAVGSSLLTEGLVVFHDGLPRSGDPLAWVPWIVLVGLLPGGVQLAKMTLWRAGPLALAVAGAPGLFAGVVLAGRGSTESGSPATRWARASVGALFLAAALAGPLGDDVWEGSRRHLSLGMDSASFLVEASEAALTAAGWTAAGMAARTQHHRDVA